MKNLYITTGNITTLIITSKKHGIFEIKVDTACVALLQQYTWCMSYKPHRKLFIPETTHQTPAGRKKVSMHRLLMNFPQMLQIDHINHDVLDNRLCNLRIVSNQQNHFNRKPHEGSSSKYVGVSFYKKSNKWACNITINGKIKSLGYYDTEEEAARVRDTHAKELFGEYAFLNLK